VKQVRLQKKQYLRFFSAFSSVILFLVTAFVSWCMTGLLHSQYAAERWKGDSETAFAQVSVFRRGNAEFSTASIPPLHESIEDALKTASLEAGTDTRLWYDAYSTQAGQTEITGKRRNPAKAAVTVVGGDFFLLHALKFTNGSPFSDNDLMHDKVVIDSQLAWQLFGSSHVEGMEVTIQNQTCLVSGVVSPESDYASKTAYGDTGRIYISYDFYQTYFDSENTEEISCYEAVLPNPVRGFAQKTITEAIGTDDDSLLIIQNTDRFSLSNRWKNLKGIRKLILSENISYPYWENAAKIISFDTSVLLLIEILFLIWPVFYLIFLLWKGYRLAERILWEKRTAFKNRYRSQIHV